MRSNFRGNERMVPHIRVHLLDVRFVGSILEKKVKVMSKFESNVQYIKYLVNRECASRFFNGELDKEINMEKETQTPHKRRVRYKGKYPKKFGKNNKEVTTGKIIKDTITA